MAHQRFRPFNTDSYPEDKFNKDMCQAVITKNTIYLCGQVAQDLYTGENVGLGDIEVQTEKVVDNIEQRLKDCDAKLTDICKVVVYLTDIRYREQAYRILGRRLKGVYPVFTGLVVAGLSNVDWYIEVDITAERE